MDVVIAAGGKGTRIKKILGQTPKPIAPIYRKKVFLDYLLNHICKYNINSIFIITGYQGDKIIKKYHNTSINLVNIFCLKEKKVLGTGGCLALIKKKISNEFIFINGDSILNINFNKFMHESKNKEIYLALCKNTSYESNKQLSKLNTKNGKIFLSRKSNYMSAGIIKLTKNLIKNYQKRYLSFEQQLYNLIKNNKVFGKKYNDFFIDIGTKKNYFLAKKLLPKIYDNNAIFLDRDGTLNIDKGYTYKINDLIFYKKTIENLKKLADLYDLFIITNQAGIAKKKFSLNDFYIFQKHIKKKLSKHDILISDVKFSPFHPEGLLLKYKKKSNFRKPGDGMLKSIYKRWNFCKRQSYMIGDQKSDYLAAKKFGINFFYAKNGINIATNKIIKSKARV
jgi:D,D-heptose 1,7-bisphosphate phosphatase